jgi:hypothetical protein
MASQEVVGLVASAIPESLARRILFESDHQFRMTGVASPEQSVSLAKIGKSAPFGLKARRQFADYFGLRQLAIRLNTIKTRNAVLPPASVAMAESSVKLAN